MRTAHGSQTNREHELESLTKHGVTRHDKAWRGTAKLRKALRGPMRQGTRARDLVGLGGLQGGF
uniref:Uncharacterized protein n=1 Tax=Fagus sylvatica TaxID=28930 RepID=A0A2N9J9I5_FAGSY